MEDKAKSEQYLGFKDTTVLTGVVVAVVVDSSDAFLSRNFLFLRQSHISIGAPRAHVNEVFRQDTMCTSKPTIFTPIPERASPAICLLIIILTRIQCYVGLYCGSCNYKGCGAGPVLVVQVIVYSSCLCTRCVPAYVALQIFNGFPALPTFL